MPPRRLVLASLLAVLAAAPARAACPSDAAIGDLAQSIRAARPHAPLGGMASLEDGLCAQGKLVALLAPHWGGTAGYKVALTAPPAQQMFGIDHPIRGVIFAETLRRRSGAEVPIGFAAVPQVEADFLLRVKDEGINAAGRDHLAILRHLDVAIPYIELPDLVLSGRPDGPNLVAINAGARLGVLGEPIPVQPTQEFADRLAAMTVTFSDDTGRQIAQVPGGAALGHPLNVVAWLVEDLAKHGQRLRAGDTLSVAGYSAPIRAEAGRTYTLRYEGLAEGPVTVSVRLR